MKDALTKALQQLGEGKSIRDIANELAPEAQRELFRRCAVVRTFDRSLVDEALRHTPTEITAEEVPFEWLTAASFVDLVPRTRDSYRLTAQRRAAGLTEWANRSEDLKRLSTRLVEYYGQKKNDLEQLYHLCYTDPSRALARFEDLYDTAEKAFDLARCAELLELFSDSRPLPGGQELLRSQRQRRARLNARTLWADDFYRTGRYLERGDLAGALDRLLTLQDPSHWALQIYAQGGAGKTMFLRWAVARVCVPRGVPVARLDFDDAKTAAVVQKPWELALTLGQQWNAQIVDQPLNEFLDQLKGPSGPEMSEPLQELAQRLARTIPEKPPVLLLLDTLEEILLSSRGTLVTLLETLARFQNHCSQFVLLLAGRYDLRSRLLRKEFGAVEAAHHQKVKPFLPGEAERFLRELRGLPASETLKAVIDRAEGNPLKLALYAEILKAEPGLTAAQIRADSDVDVAYLIRRVVLRLGGDQPTAAEKRLRWVLRYGAIPRRLTREFLTEVMASHLRLESTGQGSADDPDRGLSPSLARTKPFPRDQTEKAIDFEDLWKRLKQFAGGASWVRVVSDAEEETLLLTPDVRNPMRALLLKQEKSVFLPLHEAALAYYRRKAADDPTHRLRWLREVVYHDFQRRGEAAGDDWRELMETEEVRGRPAWRKELAEEVVGRAYIEDEAPRPLLRPDGTRMIAPADLVLAYCYLAEAHIDLARANHSDAPAEWKEAGAALARLELANLNLHGPIPRPATVGLIRALIMADRGEVNAALTLLRVVHGLGGADERRRALREMAELRTRLGREDAMAAYAELLETDLPAVGKVDVLVRYARVLLAHDRIAEAGGRWVEAWEALSLSRMDAQYDLQEELSLLYNQISLRWGSPKAATSSPYLVGGGLQKSWKLAPAGVEGVAAGFFVVEALLDQRDPQAALAHFEQVHQVWERARTGGETTRRATPPPPAVDELRGRIAAELRDFGVAIDHFERARSGWVSLGASADADRVVVRLVELQMRGLGDLKKAESLLNSGSSQRPSRTGQGVPPESELRLELLRAEQRDRAGSQGARAIVDALRASVSPDWPPRFRVWLALQGLGLSGAPTPGSYFQLLVEALGEVNPDTARAALLGPLERVDSSPTLPPTLVERLRALLPGPSHHELFPRDDALLDERMTEALRVMGLPEDAAARLEKAYQGFIAGDATLFPLRELLLAEERLGRPGEAFKRGAPLVPRFLQEFEGTPLLGVSLLIEQARRALKIEDPKTAGSLLDQAEALLQKSDSRFTSHLDALRYELRAQQAALSGQANASALRGTAVAAYQRLGIAEPNVPLHFRVTATGGISLSISGSLESIAVVTGPLQPPPRSLAVALRPANEGLLIETTPPPQSAATAPPASQGRSVSSADLGRLGFWGKSGRPDDSLPEGFAPFPSVIAFVDNWRAFGERAWNLLQPPNLVGRREAGQTPTDLRLEVLVRSLFALPWEFLTRPDGQPGLVAGSNAVRHFYRAGPVEAAGPVPIRWLQQALRRLVAPTLAVDGVDGPELREAIRTFQEMARLPITGRADAETRWLLDRHLRGRSGESPDLPRVLLLGPDRVVIDRGTRDLESQQGIDLLALYHHAGALPSRFSDLGETTLKQVGAGPPAIIHIAAGLGEDPQLGVHFQLARTDYEKSPGLRFVTVSWLDDFLKQVPEHNLPPLVILDPPWPTTLTEGVRQLFLRNAFASELFRLGHAPVILGTGLGHARTLESVLRTIITRLVGGSPVGEVADLIRRLASTTNVPLDDLLQPAGTALFAHDPESRAPGSGHSVSTASVSRQAAPRAAEPRHHVLLIGIDAYDGGGSLTGCVNDIDAIQRLLIDKVGIAPDCITRLAAPRTDAVHETDVPAALPTLDRIRAELTRLGSDAVNPGDRVLIYYSGHGTQMTVPDGTGQRFTREALVPKDKKLPVGWRLLPDWEINALIARITERTSLVTVILDCCSSAGATRDIGGEDALDRFFLIEEDYILGPDEVVPIDTLRGVTDAISRVARCQLVAACRDDERARESLGGGTRPQGELTRALVRQLAGMTREELSELRWGRIWRAVEAEVRLANPRQSPWISGGFGRYLFAFGPDQEGDPGFAVTPVGDQYRLDVGTLAGVTEDAEIAVYGSTPLSFPLLDSPEDVTERKGKLRVVRADRSSCEAVAVIPFTLPVGARGRLCKAGRAARLRVAFKPPNAALATNLKDSPLVELVSGDAELTLAQRSNGDWALTDDIHGTGDTADEPMLTAIPSDVLGAARAVVEHYHTYLTPLRMARACTDLPSLLRVWLLDCNGPPITPEEAQNPNRPQVKPGARAPYEVNDGDLVCFVVENGADDSLSVTLIDCADSGRVLILGEKRMSPRSRHVFWLQDILGKPFRASLAPDHLLGVDRIAVIGTTRPDVSLRHLETRTSFAELIDQFREREFRDLVGADTSSPAERWTSAVTTLRIVRPNI
jgi:hypothetical protein